MPPPPAVAARRLSQTKAPISSSVGPKPTRTRNQVEPFSSCASMDDALRLEQRLEARVGEGRPPRLEALRGVRPGVGGEPRRRGRARLLDLARLRRLGGRVRHVVPERAADRVAEAGHAHHVARLDLLLEERVGDGDRRRLGEARAHHQEVGGHEHEEQHPPRARPEIRRGPGPARRGRLGRATGGTLRCVARRSFRQAGESNRRLSRSGKDRAAWRGCSPKCRQPAPSCTRR